MSSCSSTSSQRSPGDLRHQRDRASQSPAMKGGQDQGALPRRGRRAELIYLAIPNAVSQWTRTRGWAKALLAFKIHFGDQLPV